MLEVIEGICGECKLWSHSIYSIKQKRKLVTVCTRCTNKAVLLRNLQERTRQYEAREAARRAEEAARPPEIEYYLRWVIGAVELQGTRRKHRAEIEYLYKLTYLSAPEIEIAEREEP